MEPRVCAGGGVWGTLPPWPVSRVGDGVTSDGNSFDVVVIGGGIVGCMNAFWLARRGMTVAILERDRIGHGTTNNSFAWSPQTT